MNSSFYKYTKNRARKFGLETFNTNSFVCIIIQEKCLSNLELISEVYLYDARFAAAVSLPSIEFWGTWLQHQGVWRREVMRSGVLPKSWIWRSQTRRRYQLRFPRAYNPHKLCPGANPPKMQKFPIQLLTAPRAYGLSSIHLNGAIQSEFSCPICTRHKNMLQYFNNISLAQIY